MHFLYIHLCIQGTFLESFPPSRNWGHPKQGMVLALLMLLDSTGYIGSWFTMTQHRFLFLYCLFIVGGGAGAEREGERISSRLSTVSKETNAGLELTNHKVMT